MINKKSIETAQFRFGIIAPVVQNTYPDASVSAYFRRIAATPVKLPEGKEMIYKPGALKSWLQRYREGGFDALIPKEREDVGTSRKLDTAAIAEIHRLADNFSRMNATLAYHKLIEQGFINRSEISVASIQRYFKRNDLKSARVTAIRDRKAFEEEFACQMFQADTCYGPFIKVNGALERTYLIMFLDDKSRLIVGGRYFFNDNAANMQIVFKEAVERYGIPKKLYIDNGSSYKNEQLSLICGSLGVVEIHAPVRDGASKGKIERNFRTLKDRWLYGVDAKSIYSIEDLNEMLFQYVSSHNTTVHSAINEKPIDSYMRDIDHVRKPFSREWLDECFLNRVTRLVHKDSTISINNGLFDVPMQFIGSRVEVRYIPRDMDTAFIFSENKKYPIRSTNKVENSKTKRNNTPVIDYSKQEAHYNILEAEEESHV